MFQVSAQASTQYNMGRATVVGHQTFDYYNYCLAKHLGAKLWLGMCMC